jgi:hypothetical protein
MGALEAPNGDAAAITECLKAYRESGAVAGVSK